jgi:capsular polysaccharide biosynthesis protein
MSKTFYKLAIKILGKIDSIIFGKIQETSFRNNQEIKVLPVFPSNVFQMPPVSDIDGKELFSGYSVDVPEAFVLEVKNGILIVGREEVYTADGKVIKEITAQKNNPSKGHSKRKLKKPIALDGTILSLSLSGLEGNYYHYNVEYLARLYLFRITGLDFDWVDYACESRFQKQFLKFLQIPEEKVLPDTLKGKAITCEKLIVPSMINNWEYYAMPGGRLHHMKQYIPEWFVGVHEEFRKKTKKLIRVYISRSKADRRRVLNECDVIELIVKYGFAVHHMEDLSVEEQIDLFNSAEKIIAPHGAGLVNIVFCLSPCQVLEIYPENYLDSSFRILANVLNFDYHCMVGEKVNLTPQDPQKEEIRVNLEKLEDWLGKYCS